jgi:hypothetical protein
MFRCIGNIIYSLIRFVRFKVFAEIRMLIFDLTQNKYMLKRKNIYVSERIFALTLFHTSEYSLQIIRFEEIIHKNLSKFHRQANIRSQIFAYKQIFANISLRTKVAR